jgi:hypothetical protein
MRVAPFGTIMWFVYNSYDVGWIQLLETVELVLESQSCATYWHRGRHGRVTAAELAKPIAVRPTSEIIMYPALFGWDQEWSQFFSHSSAKILCTPRSSTCSSSSLPYYRRFLRQRRMKQWHCLRCTALYLLFDWFGDGVVIYIMTRRSYLLPKANAGSAPDTKTPIKIGSRLVSML